MLNTLPMNSNELLVFYITDSSPMIHVHFFLNVGAGARAAVQLIKGAGFGKVNRFSTCTFLRDSTHPGA